MQSEKDKVQNKPRTLTFKGMRERSTGASERHAKGAEI